MEKKVTEKERKTLEKNLVIALNFFLLNFEELTKHYTKRKCTNYFIVFFYLAKMAILVFLCVLDGLPVTSR